MDGSRSAETRRRILQIAQELFSTQGLERTTMRDITAAAGVNIAAMNYHFRSKEGLIEELLANISLRINQRRREALKRYLEGVERTGETPKLDVLVDIFIEPYVDPESGHVAPLLAQLILQHRLRPTPVTRKIIAEHFDPMAQEYVAALVQTNPAVPQVEWYWRYLFMVSTVIMMLTDNAEHNRLVRLSEGAASVANRDSLRRYLRRFLIGGLSASPALS